VRGAQNCGDTTATGAGAGGARSSTAMAMRDRREAGSIALVVSCGFAGRGAPFSKD
jgi:hypothetical protein